MTHSEERNGSLTMLLAFVSGAVIGAAAALLFAPASGAETRRRMASGLDRTKETAARIPDAVREAATAAQTAFSASLEHRH